MKTFFFSFVIAGLLVGLAGCGKSEAQQERAAARLKFKEAVAAIKVRTQRSTYGEFHQAELDLKTSYEANKEYLQDVSDQFSGLDATLQATDTCWSYSLNRSGEPVYPYPKYKGSPSAWQAVLFLSPEISAKSNFTIDQASKDSDFNPKRQVEKGLAKISDQTNELLKSLETNK